MKRQKRWITGALLSLVLLAAVGAPVAAQTPGEGELRQAMREYFQKRLRAEVSLSDDQVRHILPRVTRLEDAKSELRRSRMETTRELRRGLEQGASDGKLQEMLDRLERGDREQQELERSILEEVDEVLSARQRVQLRFFLYGFRQEMQQKIREIRGGRRRDSRPRRNGP